MAQPAGQIVGRTAELGGIEQGLAEVRRGGSRALTVAGEPGIGKTRLLDELAARADEQGHLVLRGSASEFERDVPFSVFGDALDEYVAGLEPRRLELLEDDVRHHLGDVLPTVAPAAGATPPHERYLVHRAVRALLALLSDPKPLVLVLDDLHWADAGSIELLGALLRRPPAAPVLLAFAVRPRQTPDRLAAAVARAARAGTLARLELHALTRDEAMAMLGDGVDPGLAATLYAESGGNPFYLEQLARAPHPGVGDGTPHPGLDGNQVPSAVAAALADELAMLGDATRRILQGAAVAGDPFELDLAAAAAGEDDAAALDALDEMLRRDIVRHTDVPRRFRFRHPLVRSAVYEATPGGWRLRAHARSNEALLRRGAPASERAHHVERSARHGDMAAVAVLRDAGRAAAPLAPATAAHTLAAAVRLLPVTAPPSERVALLSELAAAHAATGQFPEARAALIESIDLSRDTPDLRARLIARCSRFEHVLGRHAEAHARLEDAVAALPDGDSPEAAGLMIELAFDELFRRRYDAMRTWADRARTVAARVGDRPAAASATSILALAAGMIGAIPDARAACTDAAALVEALPDDQIARRLDGAGNLAAALLYLDDIESAHRHAERALAIGRATGQAHAFPFVYPIVGAVRTARGDLRGAAELLDGSIEAARLAGGNEALAWNLFSRAMTATAMGDGELALALAEESLELLRDGEDTLAIALASVALAGALLQTGDPVRAVDQLLAEAGGEELRSVPGGWRTSSLELLTHCRLAAGRRDDAARSAARTEASAAELALPLPAAAAARARAAVELASGDARSAADRALTAVARCDEVGAPVTRATSRMLAGRALAAAGWTERAVAELERAAATFEDAGAFRHRDAAERELRQLGRRLHRRSRPGVAGAAGVESLTERELQVAQLIVDRRTNAAIAAELYLSPKTVETHVRNLFLKLDVSSRVEVARVVERAMRAR